MQAAAAAVARALFFIYRYAYIHRIALSYMNAARARHASAEEASGK